jgi:hypothetical protein
MAGPVSIVIGAREGLHREWLGTLPATVTEDMRLHRTFDGRAGGNMALTGFRRSLTLHPDPQTRAHDLSVRMFCPELSLPFL